MKKHEGSKDKPLSPPPPLPVDLAEALGLGCGDSCITGIRPKGMHTNGGCKCLRDLSRTGLLLMGQRLVHQLRVMAWERAAVERDWARVVKLMERLEGANDGTA